MQKKMEEQSTQIAVMATDIKYIKDALNKIDTKLELMDQHYIRRDEINALRDEHQKVHDDIEVRMRRVEKQNTQTATWGTVGLILLGIVQFIISQLK